MQHLEVSGAVRPLYGVVRRQRVNTTSGIITLSWCLTGMQVEKETCIPARHQLRVIIPDVILIQLSS